MLIKYAVPSRFRRQVLKSSNSESLHAVKFPTPNLELETIDCAKIRNFVSPEIRNVCPCPLSQNSGALLV